MHNRLNRKATAAARRVSTHGRQHDCAVVGVLSALIVVWAISAKLLLG